MLPKKSLFFVFTVVLCSNACLSYAQAGNARKQITLHSIYAAGLVNGSLGSSLLLQAIVGASVHRSFAGIGAGIDYYRFRSIPIFADLRQEFGKGNHKFFLYADAGYNAHWLTDQDKREYIRFSSAHRYKGGGYVDAGMGFKILFKNAGAVLISTGYSYKRIKEEVGTGICPIAGPCYEAIQTYSYGMQRLVIKAAYSF